MDELFNEESVEFPHAIITGVQFGLLAHEDAMKITIYDRKGESRTNLTDSRLGLPNAEDECKSCGERLLHKCEGHFGHIVLPSAVYHPNYVKKIVNILQKLCLNCLSVKVKQDPKRKDDKELKDMSHSINAVDLDKKYEICKASFASKIKNCKLSFTQGSCPGALPRTKQESSNLVDERHAIDCTTDGEDEEVENMDTIFTKEYKNIHKHGPITTKASKVNEKRKNCSRLLTRSRSTCQYCKKASYPGLHVKLEQNSKNGKIKRKTNVVEMISVELKPNDDEDVLSDGYVKHLGKKAEDFDYGKQYLLPTEALEILRNLSDEAINMLQMDAAISRPAALVMESVLIPPNCCRIPEKPGADQWKLGSDEITRKLGGLLRLKANQSSKMVNRIVVEEAQLLISHYFRMKGAPKVRGNREPLADYSNQHSRKKVCNAGAEKLHNQIVTKVSSFSGRAVLTGDPSISLDEIAIPLNVAEQLTISEIATERNIQKMQQLYNVGYGSKAFTDVGAISYTRAGAKTYLSECESYVVEIGDEIARTLHDGDYVFCNRPPSIHKHSILGLRAHIVDIPTFAINPLICAPLGADFDGDCLAIFVPQSLESRAETQELMMIDKQMLTSHGGECTFPLTQDVLLAAYKLTSYHSFLKRTEMEQASLLTGSPLPKPAILKSPKGQFWTGKQLFQLSLTDGVDYCQHGVIIVKSEVLVGAAQAAWLGAGTDSFLHHITQNHGSSAALMYLRSCQDIAQHWISHHGFSVGVKDIVLTSRIIINDEIVTAIDIYENSIRKKLDDLDNVLADMCVECRSFRGASGLYSRLKLQMHYFQGFIPKRVEELTLKHISVDNGILEMVTSGSKGSMRKLVEQVGALGLHSCGLIKNSFVNGLTPYEFYLHTQSYRSDMIQQTLRVAEPGMLFKNLLLHLRDTHIYYDGSVRNHHCNSIIQFCYGEKSWHNSIGVVDVGSLAGEPAGVLAATAILQAAYHKMLESSTDHEQNENICPLKLFQDTLYSRECSVVKDSDRKVILCVSKHCKSKEKAAITIQHMLCHVTLEMLLGSISILYIDYHDFNGEFGEKLKPVKNAPWVAHLSLDIFSMNKCHVTAADVTNKLKNSKHLDISFLTRCCCQTCGNSAPCILFCVSNDQKYVSVDESLSAIKNEFIPRIRKLTIRGDERIESITIGPYDMVSGSWGSFLKQELTDTELAILVHVKRNCINKKSDAWVLVRELCAPVISLIDWSRSIPASVQGVAEIFGIEAAWNYIVQRLGAILKMFNQGVHKQHISLVIDMMTHLGSVIGLNAAGFRDFSRQLDICSPLTQSFFKNPVKHIQDAAYSGKCDNLSGVLPSICWGRPAPIGTGADFEILWPVGLGTGTTK